MHPVESAQRSDVGDQLTGQFNTGPRITIYGGDPFVGHVDFRDLGCPLASPSPAGRNQHAGEDLPRESHLIPPGGKGVGPVRSLDEEEVSLGLPSGEGSQSGVTPTLGTTPASAKGAKLRSSSIIEPTVSSPTRAPEAGRSP